MFQSLLFWITLADRFRFVTALPEFWFQSLLFWITLADDRHPGQPAGRLSVSILVVLDHARRQTPGRGRPPATLGFQSLLFWISSLRPVA